MKNSLLVLSLLFLASLFTGCDEVPPPGLDFSEGALKDTTFVTTNVPAPQEKNVLIEDITGVRCNNCPKAAEEAVRLSTAEPRIKVVALYIKSSSFSPPYSGYEDLTTQAAEGIAQDTELPTGLPSGYVDRVEEVGTKKISNNFNVWESIATKQLAKSTPVNIELTSEYDGTTNSINSEVELIYTQNLTDTNHVLIMLLTESKIKGKQKMPLGEENPDYIHNHVLRASMGSELGTKLNVEYEKGRVVQRVFNLELEDHWVLENLHVLAIIQNKDTKEIIHLQEVDFK